MVELIVIGFAWVCYFTMHSLLASERVKARLLELMPALSSFYRLAYNVYALVTLMIPAAFVAGFHGPDIYAPHGLWSVADRSVQLLAAIGLLWSLTAYDFGELSGLQRSSPKTAGELELQQGGPLQLCRHPVYLFALILIWAGAHNAATLLSATLITVYVVVGMHIEEKRLVGTFGDRYREYQNKVPMILPLPRKGAT